MALKSVMVKMESNRIGPEFDNDAISLALYLKMTDFVLVGSSARICFKYVCIKNIRNDAFTSVYIYKKYTTTF